jgi:phosphatidylglycerophosphate synthase
MVLDDAARAVLGRSLQPLVRAADRAGLRPNHLTALGLALGLAAAVAAGLGAWWWALVLWLVGRLPDGLDGLLARHQGAANDHGGFIDIMADFTGYGAFVLGLGVGLPEARVACLALLLTYYLNGSAFLAISGLAEKRARDVAAGERSLQFVRGLTEGTETIVAHALFALLAAVRPGLVPVAVWVFAAMVLVTVGQRVRFGARVLRA